MSMTTMVLAYVFCFGVLGTFAYGIISAAKSQFLPRLSMHEDRAQISARLTDSSSAI
jgi:hypothetical protein